MLVTTCEDVVGDDPDVVPAAALFVTAFGSANPIERTVIGEVAATVIVVAVVVAVVVFVDLDVDEDIGNDEGDGT